MDGTTAPWKAASASVRGASHDRSGLPNQDAAAVREVLGPVPLAVAAVSDGHGGRRYVRSDRGSAFAAGIACDLTAEFLASGAVVATGVLASATADELVPAIVTAWRARVLADLAAEPLTAEERERAGDGADAEPYLLYGATLLVAAATNDAALLLQLGDGDIVTVQSSGVVTQPVPDDERLVAGETTSLGLDDAIESFRTVALALGAPDAPELILLSTDGYGNSFADPDWPTDVAGDLLGRARRQGLERIGQALPSWLSESASASGDDVTMAILHRAEPRSTARTFAVVGSAAPLTAEPPAAAVPNGPGRGRAWRAVGTALALLAVLGAGLLIGRGLADDSTTDASDPPQDIVPVEDTTDPTLAAPATDTTDESPSTESTAATTTTGPGDGGAAELEPPDEAIVASSGLVVRFNPARPTAAYRVSTSTSVPSATTTQLIAAGYRWRINGGEVVVTALDGAETARHALEILVPAGLLYADGRIWVVPSDGTSLVVCRPDPLAPGCSLAATDIAFR